MAESEKYNSPNENVQEYLLLLDAIHVNLGTLSAAEISYIPKFFETEGQVVTKLSKLSLKRTTNEHLGVVWPLADILAVSVTGYYNPSSRQKCLTNGKRFGAKIQ